MSHRQSKSTLFGNSTKGQFANLGSANRSNGGKISVGGGDVSQAATEI